MPKVNPVNLKWARETAGLSIDEACKKLPINNTKEFKASEILKLIEGGKKFPSKSLLQEMEKQYHRPLITFYLSNIPQKGSRGEDFRTLPKDYSVKDDALVDALIREIQARQQIVLSYLEEDEDGVEILPFVASMSIKDKVDSISESIIRTLHFDMDEYRKKDNPEAAFSYLRNCAESKGIFVLLMNNLGSYKTEIDVSSFRGFALSNKIAPFIVINQLDSKGALSFTLLHEITHIWLGQTGISSSNSEEVIEKFCDGVASLCLLRDNELDYFKNQKLNTLKNWQTAITKFSIARKISSSMVVYRLYQNNYISNIQFKDLMQFYRQAWIQNKKEQKERNKLNKKGPSYYVIQRYQNGNGLIQLMRNLVNSGAISTSKAGRVLGVKPKNVQFLITDY